MPRKTALFYALFRQAPNTLGEEWTDAYVVAHYSDGSVRYWYPEERGFTAAKSKALNEAHALALAERMVSNETKD